MEETGKTPPLPASVAREALAWLLKVQTGEASEADWQRWRSAHPDHERAGQRIDAVNRRLDPLRATETAELSQATHAALATPARARRRQSLKLAAWLLSSGAAGWLAHQQQAVWRPWLADLRSGPGERLRRTLDDGSRLVLDADSALDIGDLDTRRRAVLLAGQALFETATNHRGLPFRLVTRDGEIEAAGARFMVQQREQGSRIDVLDGQVQLFPRRGKGSGRNLVAGQRCLMTADGVGPVERSPAEVAAWQDGLLVARQMSLADFVEALARYSPAPIRCAPEVAGLTISGTYPLADVDQILRTLARVLPVRIDRLPRRWRSDVILVTAKPPSA